MKSPESRYDKQGYLLEADYFYETDEAPEVTMPPLGVGHVVTAADIEVLEHLALDEQERQRIAVVASYSLMRPDPQDAAGYRIWVGARKSTDRVHPDVFSIPTARLPLSYLGGLLVGKIVQQTTGESLHFDPDWTDMTRKDRPEVDRVDHVLFGKLGGGFEYERGSVHTSLASISYGVSGVWGRRNRDEQDRDLAEAIFMLDLLVYLEDSVADKLIPGNLIEYPITNWVSSETFAEAYQKGRIDELLPNDVPGVGRILDLCIHGQCVKSSLRDYRSGITQVHLETLAEKMEARADRTMSADGSTR